jgi:hypothetical protein
LKSVSRDANFKKKIPSKVYLVHPASRCCQHLWFEDTPFRGRLELVGGKARIGSSPGLGLELYEQKLKEMLIAPASW